ncbi:MAG TPA: 3-phosphoshikimate 1-carboxyvinyltransferase [Polyangiaceae bacterium]|nr:3-phosphoshikimate 1-carboxyvinyltransferase [Polyangiaceae bacterium]
MIHDLVVSPAEGPLYGSVPVPPDEGIGLLAVLCAALSDGPCELRRVARGDDVASMVAALRALGVGIDDDEKGTLRIRGVSLFGWPAGERTLDCGGSLATLRLLAGLLVAQEFRTVLTVSEPPPRAGLAILASPLRRRGGQIEGQFSPVIAGEITAPLVVGPLPLQHRLGEIEIEIAQRSAELKEAVLVSGLYADGPTYVRERFVSRDHLERILQSLEVPVSTAGSIALLSPAGWEGKIPAFGAAVPGDISATTLLLAAATLVPGSYVCARGTGLNPTRTGAFSWMRQLGGSVSVEIHSNALGEPEGTASAVYAPLTASPLAGETLVRASDDIGALVALAARARGNVEIGGISEIASPREANALATALVGVLRAFGVRAETIDDGLVVEGRPEGRFSAAEVDCHGDARLGAAATLLALLADARSRVRGVDALARRFPRVVGTLRAIGAGVHVEERKE